MATQELQKNGSIYASNQVNGEAMTRLGLKREAAIEAAELGGIKPFSVWNFNPIDIVIWVLGNKLSVPAYSSTLGIKKTVPFGGAQRSASSMVIRNLMGFSRPTSAQNEQGGDPQAPQMQYDWQVVQPVEQVRAFEFDYNERSGGVGGVLVFQGDGHEIGHSNDQLIHIPSVRRAKGGTILFTTAQVSLAEKLDQTLTRQKETCFRKLNLAQEWNDDPDKRNSVHDGPQGFAAWGQFAVDMGWKHQSELGWMVSDSAAESCKKCGKGKRSGTALFCECGSPYDAYIAYMAGHKVEIDYLAALPADKLKLVKSEMKRRENLFKDFDSK